MSNERTAIDTIVGYYYQFDYFILKLLQQENETNIVCIEGIEDVDLVNADETIAIQCKYYEKTEYNHSIIAPAIRFMLKHFSKHLTDNITYKIYGHYKSGQDKLPESIDVDFVKRHFFTFTKDSIKHELHNELSLSNIQLETFISKLNINNKAPLYEEQEKIIIQDIKKVFSCSDYEAGYFYYNNALKLIKDISTKQNIEDRKITKAKFISTINTKEALYNTWFIKKKGIEKYCKTIKKQHFSITNISPFERFFLIQCNQSITQPELKTILYQLSKKWSKLSPRQPDPFCPYVYLHNISDSLLLDLKKQLQTEDFCFIDGYNYKNADFNVKAITKKANNTNGIKLKIINNINELNEIIQYVSVTKEIYQFYIEKPFYENLVNKHIKIAIEETINVNQII